MPNAMDDFIDGARRCADVAATKTNELIEVSKLKLDKAKLRSKLREQYQKLGRLCFNEKENGENHSEEMREIIEAIKIYNKDIAWTDEQLRSALPHKVCRACGGKCSVKCTYCSYCGEKL